MKEYFDGCYYKHQKGDDTICLIVGTSTSEEFIQIITNERSYKIPFIGDNLFSDKGIKLNIQTDEISLVGEIKYENLSPIKYDIMGPFKFFPMECRHGIISMHHDLYGKLWLNGKEIDFTGGIGYIEKDSGISFPKSYTWVHCNDFAEKCSVMVSVAHIPFLGFAFQGCISIVQYKGREYRFATYLGVKVIEKTENKIVLKQREYTLEVEINSEKGNELNAPHRGAMTRTIVENASCPVRFRLLQNGKEILDISSQHGSFEYEK